MSDILTREEFEVEYDGNTVLMKHDAAFRACIQQAVEDVEKLPHGEMCQSNMDWLSPPPCNCGHDATIAGLKKGLGEK